MAVILPSVPQRPQYGFLAGLSSGLSQGLTQAAQSKLAEYQQRREMESAREPLRRLGLSESAVDILSTLPPQQRWEAILDYMQGREIEQPPQFGQGMGTMLEGMQPQQAASPTAGSLEEIVGGLGGQIPGGLSQLLAPEMQKQLRLQQAFGAPQELFRPEARQPVAPVSEAAPVAPAARPREDDFFKTVARARAKGPKEEKKPKISATVQARAFQALDTANDLENIAKQMESLLATGNVSSGFKGRFLPRQLQTDETQQFEALSNELASIIAGRSGVATNFKIKLAQAMKPNIEQNPGTQKALTKKLIETAQNLRKNAQERLGEREEEQGAFKVGGVLENLPPAASLPSGAVVKDSKSGVRYRNTGSNWVKV